MQFESFDPTDCHTHAVTEKTAHVRVPKEFWVLTENRTFVGVFNIRLQGHQTLAPSFIQQLVGELQRSQIALAGEFRPLEYTGHSMCDVLQHMQRVGNQDRARSGSSNNEQLGGLKQDPQGAMLHQISAGYGTENDDDPNDRKHFMSDTGVRRTAFHVPRLQTWLARRPARLRRRKMTRRPRGLPHPFLISAEEVEHFMVQADALNPAPKKGFGTTGGVG